MSKRSLFLALLLAAAAPMTTSAQQIAPATASAAQGTMLHVSASGQSTRAPDFATVSAGVVTQASAADAAMRENATRMTQVLAALRSAGIAERDIRTSSVTLSPQYRYEQNQPPVITGYQASNTVSVKLRELPRLGSVLDALIAHGANQINGPSFGIEHPDAAYDEARRAAVKAAMEQAKTYADALGTKVRRIVSIQEGSTSDDAPVPRRRMLGVASAAAAPTPIAGGETTLSVHIEVAFELGN